MYQEFFRLNESPFGLTPDTEFFFGFHVHQEALDTLVGALGMGEGFIKVTGEVGTGKTLVCRKLLKQLAENDNYVTAYIPNPPQTPKALQCAFASELGVECRDRMSAHDVMKALNEALIQFKTDGKSVVLLLDEAQALPEDCLETIRLLSNLETEKSKLLSVILFGQPELDVKLAKPSIRQLKQRITFSHNLAPMTVDATLAYLNHRMTVAGYVGEPLFSAQHAKLLHKLSGGIPRLINILAHKTLLLAYGVGSTSLKTSFVKRAGLDTESAMHPGLGLGWQSVALVTLISLVLIATWLAQGVGG